MDERLSPSDPSRTRRFGGGPLLAVALLLLPILYVLSSGPAIWLAVSGYVPGEVVEAVYAPLIWAADRSETVERALTWYHRHWVPQAFSEFEDWNPR